ncbi:MAG: VanW family protein [Clostridia bacterium]|nr:VanW family protein [Clostridia bacterium]
MNVQKANSAKKPTLKDAMKKAHIRRAVMAGTFAVVLIVSIIIGAKLKHHIATGGLSPEQLERIRVLALEEIYQGVSVEGVDLSEKTKDEAVALLAELCVQKRKAFKATLKAGEQTWEIDGDLAGYDIVLQNTLDKAYNFGREGSEDARWAEIQRAAEQGVDFAADMEWNQEKVKAFIAETAATLEVAAVNAQVVAFRPEKLPGAEAWEFQAGTMGIAVDHLEEVETQVIAALEKGEYGKVFEMTLREVPPTLSLATLQTSTVRFSTYVTDISNNADRMINIDLASAAITGTILMPGEEFSFNKTVGPRTPARGYKEQLIPIRGEMVPDPGGGVCQVAGTLYQAVLHGTPDKTQLQIVERHSHSITSTYMAPALDATVYYGNLDLRFKNNRATPIYIVRSFDKSARTLRMSLYGAPLPEGMTIKTSSEVTETVPPPEGEDVKVDDTLQPGEIVEVIKARQGTRAKCWRTVFMNGTQVGEKELITTDHYPPTKRSIRVGPDGRAVETPTPDEPIYHPPPDDPDDADE